MDTSIIRFLSKGIIPERLSKKQILPFKLVLFSNPEVSTFLTLLIELSRTTFFATIWPAGSAN